MRLILVLCLLVFVAACGAKGPLNLPDGKTPQKQSK
jgi:predicted small lipoprotein YifL